MDLLAKFSTANVTVPGFPGGPQVCPMYAVSAGPAAMNRDPPPSQSRLRNVAYCSVAPSADTRAMKPSTLPTGFETWASGVGRLVAFSETPASRIRPALSRSTEVQNVSAPPRYESKITECCAGEIRAMKHWVALLGNAAISPN